MFILLEPEGFRFYNHAGGRTTYDCSSGTVIQNRTVSASARIERAQVMLREISSKSSCGYISRRGCRTIIHSDHMIGARLVDVNSDSIYDSYVEIRIEEQQEDTDESRYR